MMHPATIGIDAAAEILLCGTENIYELIDKGHLPAAKIGRAWVMLADDVLDYAARQITEQTQARRKQNAKLFAGAHGLLSVALELDECAAYWSEYDVPIGIHDRLKAAIAKALGPNA